jgi:hypothetical protein
MQLVELGLNLRWLNDIFLLRVRVILDLDLLITFSRDSNGELELTSYFTEGFRFWVRHNDPFVQG